jgi:hypothetical protein
MQLASLNLNYRSGGGRVVFLRHGARAALMADYRLYCLDGRKHISSGEWIGAMNDAQAVAFAKAKKLNVTAELWDRNRLVARIPAYPS